LFGHRQPRQRDAHARPGARSSAEDEHRLSEHADSFISSHSYRCLARALADAARTPTDHRARCEVVDQLLDQHGLADAGAAEQATLPPLRTARQVDDLDPVSNISSSA